MKLQFILIFTLFASTIGATEFSGIIIDKETKTPISFGSISILKSTKGTITNNEGEFTIKDDSEEIKVICSSLGFLTDSFTINASTKYNKLELQPIKVDLNEVAVTPETYPKYLIQKAIKKIQNADSTVSIYSNAFYRQFTKSDTIPTEFQEIIYSAASNKIGLYGISIEKGRYAVKEKGNIAFDNMFWYANKYLWWGSVKYDYKNITTNDANLRFELLSIINSGNQKVAVIKTSPRVSRSKKHNDSVIYYVNTENYNILECKNTYYPEKFIRFGNPMAKVKDEKVSYDIKYKVLNDSVITADIVKVTITFGLQYGLLYTNKNEVNSTILFSNQTITKPSTKFNEVSDNAKDRKTIESIAYDSIYWANNSAFKTTNEEEALIKSFNKSNSFDSLTKKKK